MRREHIFAIASAITAGVISVPLTAYFLIGAYHPDGWIGVLRAACVLILTYGLLLFISLQIIRDRCKALWFYLEAPRTALLVKVLAITLLALLVAIWIIQARPSHVPDPGPMVILLTGVLATIGWNYTVYENRRAEIRRFTVETIEKMIEDPAYSRLQAEIEICLPLERKCPTYMLFQRYCNLASHPHYREIAEYISTGAPITSANRRSSVESAQFETARKIYVLGRYCDHLEWLAMLIRQQRIDETFAREMLRDRILGVTEALADYFNDARNTHEEYFEHIRWLKKRWS